jgi:hypothetical protein
MPRKSEERNEESVYGIKEDNWRYLGYRGGWWLEIIGLHKFSLIEVLISSY